MSFIQKPKYQLNIKSVSNNEKVKEFYNNFSSHYDGDSGIDLYNFSDINVAPLQVETIDFEIQCEMIDIETNNYVSYYLVPRSSISNTCFQMANSIGIIDAGYRGNIKAKIRSFNMVNNSIMMSGSYFQIVAPDLKPIKVNIVSELKKTSRNDSGFGSTII
jgi:dUTP pyrophosphatase